MVLLVGRLVLCDCEMVGVGIICCYLFKGNDVIVMLNDLCILDLVVKIGNMCSVVVVELWELYIEGVVVVIGNVLMVLFYLLELID